MQIIDCQKIADEFNAIIRDRIAAVEWYGATPCVNFIVIDEESVNAKLIHDKHAFAERIGIKSKIHKLNKKASQEDIGKLIKELNSDDSVHAISLQNHLPKTLSFRNLVNLIDVDKDVEGLTTLNQGRLVSGEPGIVPCTPLGVLHLLRRVYEKLEGMHVVVVGRSSVVGRPLTQLLLNANCTVTLLHSYSRNLPEICRSADILVSAVGQPRFITEEYVRKGATVIDVGVSKVVDGVVERFEGDVDFDNVKEIAGAVTMVRGVETISLTYLMHNILKLACCY